MVCLSKEKREWCGFLGAHTKGDPECRMLGRSHPRGTCPAAAA